MSNAADALHEPFEKPSRQREAATFGLWTFLASEVIFFGGLLVTYAVYRFLMPDGFADGARETNVMFGSVNTAILLTSSATMAAASIAARAGLKRTVVQGLSLTLLLGFAFLVVKGFEYREDITKHLIPGSSEFPIAVAGAEMFFTFYWLATGVHAIHLTIGLGAVATTLFLVREERIAWSRTGALHALGLYWHLIDVIWIFLYPILYLVGRAQ